MGVGFRHAFGLTRPRVHRGRNPRLVPVRRRLGTAYIEPGLPWQNPLVESFNGKARDELLAREIFDSVMEGRVLWEDY
jgi:hypothetical protein